VLLGFVHRHPTCPLASKIYYPAIGPNKLTIGVRVSEHSNLIYELTTIHWATRNAALEGALTLQLHICHYLHQQIA